ncbi:MAG: type II secretion system protein GspN [Myxococcota bacterium]
MSDALSTPTSPRPLRLTGILFAALALTFVFILIRFPYDLLAERVADSVERQTGMRISLGEISVGIVKWGPGLEAEAVRIVRPNGARFELDQVGARPALSLSWLTGNPALALEVSSVQGEVDGVATFGDAGGFHGTLANLDLAQLPPDLLRSPLQLEGIANADVALDGTEAGTEGKIRFDAQDGSLGHPNLPFALPFTTFSGDLDLGGDAFAEIRDLNLDSPLASGRGRGTVGKGPSFANAPLRLEIELTVSGAIQSSLASQGVKVGRDGTVRVTLMGTPARPTLR